MFCSYSDDVDAIVYSAEGVKFLRKDWCLSR